MKQGIFTLLRNSNIAENIWEMTLEGDTSEISTPGQFVEISLPGFFLRRPISVCCYEKGHLTLIYKKIGRGTEAMTKLMHGEKLDLLTGLGNGYNCTKSGNFPLLVGGGVGVPPLYGLAKELSKKGVSVSVILGFNTKAEMFYADKFLDVAGAVAVTTVDGSLGAKGFVTDVLPESFTHLYACGPLPMLRALQKATEGLPGEFSMEERMGCGFGVCMGCSIMTKEGSKRVCKDGPVFDKEILEWQTAK